MPKIISYTPAWLSRPSPGFDLFSPGPDTSTPPLTNGKSIHTINGSGEGELYGGPQRTIARRGTEVFVTVGNELRWSDLCLLKNNWEENEKQRQSKGKEHRDEFENGEGEGAAERGYRVSTSWLM